MKILHVDPERGFGGGERQVLGLIRHLAGHGHENLLGAAPESALWSMVPPGDARRLELPIRNDLDLAAAWRISRIFARESPDLVHFHTARAHAMSLWLPGVAPRALVTRRMDYAIRRGWHSHLLYNRRVAAVAAISGEVRRQLLAAGVDAGRIRVIPSGIEVPDGHPGNGGREAARRRFGAGDEAVIAVVAALERRKGHDVLIEALGRLREQGLRFRCLVCGEGSQRGALEEQVRRQNLSGAVHFLGHLRQVADVLAAADLLVLPSRQEGLGVAILEAMAQGLPVVASAVGGIPEVVEDGGTGSLVPPEDASALAEAIAGLLREPQRGRELGARGRQRVRDRFSMAGMAAGYEALYEEVRGRCGTGVDRR